MGLPHGGPTTTTESNNMTTHLIIPDGHAKPGEDLIRFDLLNKFIKDLKPDAFRGRKTENFKPRYLDEYTGEVLPADLIHAAIVDELNYFNDRVWEIT